VRFLYTRGKPGVRAWDVPEPPDTRSLDVKRYQTLLTRAVETVLESIRLSVNGGYTDNCCTLFPIKNAEPLGEGGTQRLDGKSISNVNNFVNGNG
jgi:hypothetical protein